MENSKFLKEALEETKKANEQKEEEKFNRMINVVAVDVIEAGQHLADLDPNSSEAKNFLGEVTMAIAKKAAEMAGIELNDNDDADLSFFIGLSVLFVRDCSRGLSDGKKFMNYLKEEIMTRNCISVRI